MAFLLLAQVLLEKYLKKLTGNTEIEGAMQKLDELTQEEVRIASAELMKITHGMNGNVLRVDDNVKGVHDRVQGISDDVQDVGKKVQDVEDKVQGIDSNLDQLSRSSLPHLLTFFETLRYPRRESTPI
jgi:methyl-accepting chemotaxis protein